VHGVATLAQTGTLPGALGDENASSVEDLARRALSLLHP
jgi:hypothetical protein